MLYSYWFYHFFMSKSLPKILIVEDEHHLRTVLKESLKKKGFDIDLANDGEKALTFLERNNYDAVLLDLILPKKDGFEVLKEIKGKKQKPPVIVLSNLSQREYKEKTKNLGANDYLVKAETDMATICQKLKNSLKAV